MAADYAYFYQEDTEPLIYYSPQKTSNIIIKLTHQGDIIKGYNDVENDRWEANTTMTRGMDALSQAPSHIGDAFEDTVQDHMQVKQFGR